MPIHQTPDVRAHTTEYRAVFGHINGTISYSDPVESLAQAAAMLPPRADETLAVRVAIQSRPIQPWRWVPLDAILIEHDEASS